jgi:pyruvate dehydrogenase E2 component (dihydrolipoamide acetyltransferase)
MARKLAADLGADLTLITGHGVGGRILVDDVRARATDGPDAMQPKLSDGTGPAQDARVVEDGAAAETSDYVEVSVIQRVTGARMLRSVREAPQFALSVDVELTESERLRARRDTIGRRKPSYTALLVRVVATALVSHPQMNVAYDEGGLRRFRDVNVGVAMATPHGLLVPVIHNADRLSLDELHRDVEVARAQADGGQLPLRLIGHATFTISNLGMYGVDRFTAILNPPEAGILAVGRIAHRPMSVKTAIESRLLVTLTLTVDHRAVDGAEAAIFLMSIRDLLENPYDLI